MHHTLNDLNHNFIQKDDDFEKLNYKRITSTSKKRKEQKFELNALRYHIAHTWSGDECAIAKPNSDRSIEVETTVKIYERIV